MTDITDLFNRVAPADTEPSAETVEADLARGRQALVRDHRRRTIRRSMAATTTVAAAAVAVLVASQIGSGTAHHPATAGHPSHTQPRPPAVVKAHPHHASSIKLVAYTGDQLAGFTVDKIPNDWFLSTSTQYALLIDPKGDTDNDPNAFVGKLAVLTQSQDVHSLPPGTHVTVNGQPGTISDQGSYGLNLTYNDPAGFGVVVQAPAQLHWTDAQLVSFAEGVHVTNNALQGRG